MSFTQEYRATTAVEKLRARDSQRDRSPRWTAAFHCRVDAGVVRAKTLFEEGCQKRAVDQMVEHRCIGEIPHEIDLPVEDRQQLLEPHDKRVVKARVLMQGGRYVNGVAAAGALEQIAQPTVQRHANLVGHPEGEHGELRPLKALWAQKRPRTEQLHDVGTGRRERTKQFAIAAVNARCRGQYAPFDLGGIERVQEQLEPSCVNRHPLIERLGVRWSEL